jgi:hypothetical protein
LANPEIKIKMQALKTYKHLTIFLLLSIFSTILFAQQEEIEEVSATYIYNAPSHESPDQAKQKALEQAKTEAIAKKFGTNISRHTTLLQTEENGEFYEWYISIGSDKVNGTWLETIDETIETAFIGEHGGLVIKASVRGKAREIKRAGIDFKAKVLKNGTENKYESTDFKNGDDLFLWFSSPADGYLAVYLVDYNSKTASCLLPYSKDKSGKVKINAGKEYIFFSKNHVVHSDRNIVEEYVLKSERPIEYYLLYIIFSPNEFTKAHDHVSTIKTDGLLRPREMTFIDFEKWLSDNEIKDKNMKSKSIPLTLKK